MPGGVHFHKGSNRKSYNLFIQGDYFYGWTLAASKSLNSFVCGVHIGETFIRLPRLFHVFFLG